MRSGWRKVRPHISICCLLLGLGSRDDLKWGSCVHPLLHVHFLPTLSLPCSGGQREEGFDRRHIEKYLKNCPTASQAPGYFTVGPYHIVPSFLASFLHSRHDFSALDIFQGTDTHQGLSSWSGRHTWECSRAWLGIATETCKAWEVEQAF
jgi:hypothetical protein